MLNPGCASGRESPIRIEFEDEKTSTLLELLNQISAEISDKETPKIKPIWRPPLRTVPARAMAANNTRSLTAPELKIVSRKASPAPTPGGSPRQQQVSQLARSRELPLCPSKLIATSGTAGAGPSTSTATAHPKKAAPTAPSGALPPIYKPSSKPIPFSVERGLRGTPHGVPAGNSSFDIHVVDLDEKSAAGKDNVSDISSIASSSPQRPRHRN